MSALSVLACWVIGVILVCLQGINSLKSDVEHQLQGAIYAVDSVLNSSDVFMDELFPLANSCEDAKVKMVDKAISYPGIQTISLLKDNLVYCSTYAPLLGKQILDESSPVQQLILVSAKNSPVPGKHIAIFSKKNDNITIAMTLINGYTLFNFLDMRGQFTLQSLGKWMNSSGEVYNNAQPVSVSKASNKLNITVNNKLSQDDYYTEIMNRYIWVMALVFLISLFIGLFVYRVVAERTSVLLMKESLKNNEFVPFAQPIMNNKGELHGVEIITRWKHESLGVIDPSFIRSEGQSASLMVLITSQLIKNSVNILEQSMQNMPKGFHIGLNVSQHNFLKDHQRVLFESCQEFVDSSLNGQAELVLELTENGIINDYESVSNIFDTLSWMGVKMAIDDFGTGHASLSEIKNLKFDFIKIDKSFISLIGSDAVSEPLVENIIDLSKRLEIPLIGEGVERQDQLDYLLNHGVEYIQGDYYAEPMELTEFIEKYL